VFGGVRSIIAKREFALAMVCLLVIFAVVVVNPRFLSPENTQLVLLSWAAVVIVAIGQAFVIITKNIDLSVGAALGLSAFVAGDLLRANASLPLWTAALAAVLCGVLLGAINALLSAYGRVPAIVATLGTLFIFRSILSQMSGGGNQINAISLPESVGELAAARVLGLSPIVFVAVFVVLMSALVLSQTQAGRSLYAVGGDDRAARHAGFNPTVVRFLALTLCGGLAGLGGFIWLVRYGSVEASAGAGFEFEVIAAVVVGGVSVAGGIGTPIGVALGALLLAVLRNGLTVLNISQFWLTAVYGAAIIVAIVLDRYFSIRLARSRVRRNP
jgi:rhamnose transport system permease protein